MSTAEVVDPADDLGVERILVVMAHPDDVDFGAAGSVAAWTAAGVSVSYCILTDGEAGGSDRSLPRSEMARIRRDEQTKAAAEVGVTDLRFLGWPDGALYPTLEVRRDISRVIRQVRPQRVVAQSPERIWERVFASHPDHLAAGEATISAVYPDSRNPFAHSPLLDREGLEPWTVDEVWLMASPRPPDRVVDTTATFDHKVAALLQHHSQLPDPARMEPMLREWGQGVAAEAGLPAGRVAEGFVRLATA